MRRYMHVGFATVLFFSFSAYSGDREIAQSFNVSTEEISVEMREFIGDYKKIVRQLKIRLKSKYKPTKMKLRCAINAVKQFKEIKDRVSNLVDLIIDNNKNGRDLLEGGAGEKHDELVKSFTTMVDKYSNINILNKNAVVLCVAMCAKEIVCAEMTLLIQRIKAELRK